MRIVRAIMVAVTALSVAVLPIAGIGAHAFAPETIIVGPLDCCSQAEHCDKQTKGDCGKSAECTLKCAGVSALPVAPARVAFSPLAAPPATTLADVATARSSTPPSPPPRV